MRKLKSAKEAIELTVKSRIEELETGVANFSLCSLCIWDKQEETVRKGTCPSPCAYCPVMKITGHDCVMLKGLVYGHRVPDLAVSFILAIQYYWEHRAEYNRGKRATERE